jgi:hypothetical protein
MDGWMVTHKQNMPNHNLVVTTEAATCGCLRGCLLHLTGLSTLYLRSTPQAQYGTTAGRITHKCPAHYEMILSNQILYVSMLTTECLAVRKYIDSTSGPTNAHWQ